jgi:transitional endoplasmic reticulum ATPase
VDAIDPALRRPGRFDREIEIGVPNEVDRSEILKIHTRGMPVAKDVELQKLSQQTHGFVGADLAALAREGAIRALRRYLPDIDLEADEIPADVLDRMEVLASDFREALRDVGPSAMREVLLEVPHTRWEDVGGLGAEKEEVREAVEYPLTQRARFERLGIEPPKGVLLYGPPGTGKTLIARAVATESGANFIPVRGPQLLSKWVGESERAVREIFKKARQVAPSIIFFDELDALAPARGSATESHVIESVLNQILTEMDGLLEMRNVVVMGATNRLDIVDPALLRTGRYDRLVYIGEPTAEDRKRILAIHTRGMPIAGSAFDRLVESVQHLTEAELENILEPMGTDRAISLEDVASALEGHPRPEGELQNPLTGRRIMDLLSARHLALDDPVREFLIAAIAAKTDGYVGSDLEGVCREAGMLAMREGAGTVTEVHFDDAVKKVRPTMNERSREYYRRMREFFKGGLPKEVQPPEYQ